jgi:hypothetical protein
MMRSFSPTLLSLAQTPPSALQLAAMKGLELWALIGSAQAEAAAQGDERLSFALSLIDAALSLPEPDPPGATAR